MRVKQDFVAGDGVAEYRLPERPDVGDVEGVDRDLHVLHGRRVGRRLQAGRDGRDLPSKAGVPAGEAVNLGRTQPDGQALGSHIDVRVVAGSGRQFADGGDQGQPGRKGAGQEASRRVSAAQSTCQSSTPANAENCAAVSRPFVFALAETPVSVMTATVVSIAGDWVSE